MPRIFRHAAAVFPALLMCAGMARAELSVVATIPPVHSLVAKVMAGAGEPHLLLRNGQSPHDYALRPSDAHALEKADLVFFVSHRVESFLDGGHAAEERAGRRFVELGDARGVTYLPVREGVFWGADEGHGHGSGHKHQSGDHDHEGDDPHLWLSPRNAQAFVGAIAVALAEKDPANAALYQSNAAAAQTQIGALSKSIAAQLAPVRSRPFLVFHDAYQYFEAEFGLRSAGAISLGTGAPPGAGRLRELRRRISEVGVRCIFREVQFSPRLAEVVAEDTGARLGLLDPVGSGLAFGPDNYDALMQGLADGFRTCLE